MLLTRSPASVSGWVNLVIIRNIDTTNPASPFPICTLTVYYNAVKNVSSKIYPILAKKSEESNHLGINS